jgi:tetratricopeptide (TPR) repeat protein
MLRHLLSTGALAVVLLAAACGRHHVVAAPPITGPTPESLYASGLAAFHEGTPTGYTRAADAFRVAWQSEPNRCEYALNLAQSLLFLATEQILNWEEFEPRQTEAKGVVDSVASDCAVSHEPFVLRLRALIAGRGPTATELINRAVELDSNDAMNWLVLGYLDPQSRRLTTLEGSGRWVAMAHASELMPDSALIQYETGKNYQLVPHKEVEARQAFERAVQRSPKHFRTYLGMAYSADENTDVEPLYKKVVEIAPNFLEGRIAAGSYYAAVEEIEKAAEQYSAAVATNSFYDTAYFRLGLLMIHADRPDEAEKHFRKVVELSPASWEAYYYIGNILYGRKEYDEAKQQYEQAVKLRINYAEAEYGIGWVYRQQNQTDLALAQFDKVLKIRLDYGDAYLSRGDIRSERRQFSEALDDYQKAIQVYEAQIKSLNVTIADAEARLQSRVMQAEKKRAERDKARVQATLQLANRYKSETEERLK